jgi:hypothetical protein
MQGSSTHGRNEPVGAPRAGGAAAALRRRAARRRAQPGWRPWFGWLAAGTACLLVLSPGSAQAQVDGSEVPLDGRTEASLQEISRQVNNPIGPLWQLTLFNELVGLRGGGLDDVEPSYTVDFQPTLPVSLDRLGLGRQAWASGLGVVAQLTLPFVETVPLAPGSGGGARSSGLGDIQLGAVLAPTRRSGWLWGIGPTFVFPSASDDALGQGKWQAGPAAVAGYMGKKWTAYAIAQQWWSFAGAHDRPATSQLSLEYVLLRSLPGRWQVGMQPTLSADWKASGGNRVSFPVGLGAGRTIRIGGIPVQLWLEADYYPVRPDDVSGPRWGVQLQVIPVVPPPY